MRTRTSDASLSATLSRTRAAAVAAMRCASRLDAARITMRSMERRRMSALPFLAAEHGAALGQLAARRGHDVAHADAAGLGAGAERRAEGDGVDLGAGEGEAVGEELPV